MASDDDIPRGPVIRTWRPEAPPPEEPPAEVRPWRRDREPPANRGVPRARRVRTAILALVALVCLGLLIWVSSWLVPPRPACLVLLGAGYEDNLAIPPNFYGRESLTALADLTRPGKGSFITQAGQIRLRQDPIELRRDSAWDNGLDAFEEKTVVLYFALHGGSDLQGDRLSAYLLPDDADPGNDPRNRLRLAAIIERLGKLPPEKNKLLILDATQVEAYWPFGMLHNDFARALKELEPQITAIPNLAVLCATDSDQRSWTSDEWQRTVFAHYLVEGLRGAADDTHSGRINAWKLYRYVRSNVERWVRINRQELQTPLLLPQGEEGRKRAEAMYLTMVQEPYEAPDPNQVPAFALPAEWQQTWMDYRRLAEQMPSPAVYSPHLWRQYQLVLLRYEYLLQAGDQTSAAAMAGRLRDLERQILQAQRLELLSFHNTLTMPAAAGWTGEPAALVVLFNSLWGAQPAEYRKTWSALQQKVAADPVARRLLPLKMADLLLDRAAENQGANLAKAVELLQVVADPLRPQPAEAHFAVMLRRDLPARSDAILRAFLLPQSLRLRKQAERAVLATTGEGYPYSEQVVRWTRALVQEADQQRRAGEDLVFATDGESWEKSKQYLARASQLYQQAQTQGEAVKYALAVRDRLLSMLPHYSHWLANRRRSADLEQQTLEAKLVAETEAMWQQTHQLIFQLEQDAPAGVPVGGVDFAGLRKLAEQLDQKLNDLQTRWTESWREATVVSTPAAWRSCLDALTVPTTDPQVRSQVLTSYRRIARELLRRTAQNDPQAAAVSVDENRRRVQERAQRQGRLALAILGQRWFDQAVVARRETFQEVSHRLDTFAVEEKWWLSLARAGEQIAARLQQMPAAINRAVQTSHQTTERDKGRAALQTADRLARQIGGVFCPAVEENPADLYRRWLVQDLLLIQAQRTLDDHWYSEEANAPQPYYRAAGLVYLDDVRRLYPHQKVQTLAAADTLQQHLKLPGELTLPHLPPVLITSEQRFTIEYQVAPAPGALVPPGHPVFWVESDKYLQSLNPPPDERVVRTLGADKPPEPVRAILRSPYLEEAESTPPPLPGRQRAQLHVRGLFRGQRIDRSTPVDLYPLPEMAVIQTPGPHTGSLTLRAPKELHHRFGAGSGSVVFVVDCSGSMGEPPGKPFTPQTKYNEVTTAIRNVLQKLPRGTTVSLWVFGQAVGAGKTTDQPEATIARIQPPITWEQADPEQLKRFMARIQYPALEPWNESPIVRAMIQAKEDLKNAPGFKTMVVLTDGMDNRIQTDRVYNPQGQDVATVLREQFQESGIALNIVGFRIVSKEEQAARAQYKIIESFPIPGKFYDVTKVEDLAVALERSVRQRLRYWLDNEDNSVLPNTPADGLDVSAIGANDQWFPYPLAPAGYKIRTYTTQRLQKDVILTPGDLLLVQLRGIGKGFDLRRGLYARDDFPTKPRLSKADWEFSVLQNQRVGDRGLQLFATLEKAPVREEALLQVIKPRATWIEVQPVEGKAPFAQRLAYRWGYPAPAWTLDVPSWPLREPGQVPALPAVRLWWNPDQEFAPAAVVERDQTEKTLLGMPPCQVFVAGDLVGLESILLEKHVVETKPGGRALKNCLVVRLNYAPEKPVFVRLRGLQVEGEEHRFYTEAHKYTGLFWPVEEKDVETTLTGLGMVSVPAFKRDAEQRGYYLEMDKLGVPQATDVRPLPPVELK